MSLNEKYKLSEVCDEEGNRHEKRVVKTRTSLAQEKREREREKIDCSAHNASEGTMNELRESDTDEDCSEKAFDEHRSDQRKQQEPVNEISTSDSNLTADECLAG